MMLIGVLSVIIAMGCLCLTFVAFKRCDEMQEQINHYAKHLVEVKRKVEKENGKKSAFDELKEMKEFLENCTTEEFSVIKNLIDELSEYEPDVDREGI